jgi:large subunit ribosomal protein L35
MVDLRIAVTSARKRIRKDSVNGAKKGDETMPKLKTNRAAAKRFRKTAKGFKSYSAGRRHNLGHKSRKTKRQLRSGGSSLIHESDVGRLAQLLPHA